MANYQNGKIYKIVNLTVNDDCECYVGSTCDTLTKRFAYHKRDADRERYANMFIYQKMKECGIDNFRIILVEDWPCKNKSELLAREEYHRVKIGAKYNMRRAAFNDKGICTCKCGSVFRNAAMWKHAKTKKHIAYINTVGI